MKRLFSLLATLALFASAIPVHAATLNAGDVIKASGQAVYYYGANGKRYVFPTEKTYKSWYADFTGVKTITDSELAAITIGGNVTYKPGVRMVKVTTDPRVYAVDGRQLRWVKSEAAANAIFGADWAKQIDDIPDAFFVNYSLGADVSGTSDFVPTTVRSGYTSIQATLDNSAPTTPTPTPTPDPTPSLTPTSTTASILGVITDKVQAQPNEQIFVVAHATTTAAIDHIELFADGNLMTKCNSASCSNTWIVPIAGVKSSYRFQATLYLVGGATVTASTDVAISSAPVSGDVQITSNRTTVRPNDLAHLRVTTGASVNGQRTEIYYDGSIIKTCSATSTANDCRYDNYLSGALNSTHEIYAIVRATNALQFKSNTLMITIGNNSSPAVTVTAGKSAINKGESIDVTVTAEDEDGVAQSQIVKDGTILKTCTGATPCTITTGPWTTAGTLTFEGRAVDLLGATSTAVTIITVQ